MDTPQIIPKEISWMAFNAKVLQEATDSGNPILDRLHFLGIYSNNLDEFYRVRMATLHRLSHLGKKAYDILGYHPQVVIEQIHQIAIKQQSEFAKVYDDLINHLKNLGVDIINVEKLDEEQKEFVNKYFTSKVQAQLMPIMLSQTQNFPKLQDNVVYLAVEIIKHYKTTPEYSLIEIPTNKLPRFIIIPSTNNRTAIMFLDDIIRYGLSLIFKTFDIKELSAYTIKFTKDAELDIKDDVSETYSDKLLQSLKKRKDADAVRLIYDKKMPKSMLLFFLKKLKLKQNENIIPGGRYHNFKDFLQFPHIDTFNAGLQIKKTFVPKILENNANIFNQIDKKDILLYLPYNKFASFIEMLRDASIDPNVKSIKITLYRLAKNSGVIDALINAARNGKEVTAVIELQARFDEEANLHWSEILKEEGVKIIHGIPKLKIHAKACLIERVSKQKKVLYAIISTGNFNESTSKIYTDALLFTSNPKITREICKLFHFFTKNFDVPSFNHLIVSPFDIRRKLKKMIYFEIEQAQKKKPAFIYIKVNNLVDNEVIQWITEAALSGVKVILLIRGMNAIKPDGIKGLEVRCVIDKYLEHSRFFIFANAGQKRVFIASSDLMTRSLDRRVEIICPIYDTQIQKNILDIFNIHASDNVKARIHDNNLQNKYYKTKNSKPIRSQFEIANYLYELDLK